MSNVLSKKHMGYALGALLAIGAGSLALSGALPVHAQALDASELFGGAVTGDEFAGAAGLGDGDLVTTISSIIRIALGFLGIIAVIIILLGGFKWMTAGGHEDKVKDAKKLIFSGIIGLVIILSAYAIASFVIENIVSAVDNGNAPSGG